MDPRRTYTDHARALVALGLPLIGSHLAQIAIGVTDTLMLGRYDATALAAGVLGSTVLFTVIVAGSGFAWAVMPLVAAASSSGDTTQIRRVTRMGMWLSVAFALAVMPLMLRAEPLLLAIGQEPQVAALAGRYLAIAGWGLIPALLVMVLKSHLSAVERARVVLWVTVAAAVMNGLFNYMFIFGNWGAPELGIRGAALASLLAQVGSLAIVAVYAARAFPADALFVRLWRPDRDALARVFAVGWPIGLTALAESGLFAASSLMVGWLGAEALAAHGIALQLASLAFMVHLGLSNAATVRAGHAFGRRDREELARGGVVAAVLSAGFAVLTAALFLAAPEWLVGLFLDPGDPQAPAIVALGASLVVVAALFQLADGAQVVALGLLRGVQDTRVPMVIAGVSYWLIGVPASYLLGFVAGIGAVGVWLGLVVGLAAAAAALSLRFWRRSVPRLAVAA